MHRILICLLLLAAPACAQDANALLRAWAEAYATN